jgi:cyclin-dependent kinase-like
MEKYDILDVIGEGSYGLVVKCRHRQSGQLVAIKKFIQNEDDTLVKKIAMREIRMLKQLRHENLVNLVEVFRRKKRICLVFEFVEHSLLDQLEQYKLGFDYEQTRRILWQVLKGIEFCHLHNIIHRDIKPENILVSMSGLVKLCDFGFARMLAQPGEVYTDYVATRWYRAPELLVGETHYTRAIDIWAVGCLLAELVSGEPLFPGDSDADQLSLIMTCFGELPFCGEHIATENPLLRHVHLLPPRELKPLDERFTKQSPVMMNFMKWCLCMEPNMRPTCSQLLRHDLFVGDGFAAAFKVELKELARVHSTLSVCREVVQHATEPTYNLAIPSASLKQPSQLELSYRKKPKRILPEPKTFAKPLQ